MGRCGSFLLVMLTIKRFENQLMSSNCYLIIDERSHHCICIDPASEKSFAEIEYIDKNKLVLDYIILTHEHTDHTWGCNSLVQHTHAQVICSKICQENLGREFQAYFQFYYDNVDYHYTVCHIDHTVESLGCILDWYGRIIEFIATPGHSMGSICVKIEDCLFSGDTLLQSKPYINRRNGSKEEFQKSLALLTEKFNSSQVIYPGHGEVFQLKNINDYDRR